MDKISDLIIRFPNQESKIIEYTTKNIDLEKITEYYLSQPTLNEINFKELDIYNIKSNDILLPDINKDINWRPNIKDNLLGVVNSNQKNPLYKEYLIINFTLDNENYFKKNRNMLLVTKKHPCFIFTEKTVEYHESPEDFKVFSLDWDFCLIEEKTTKNIKFLCKKQFVSSLIIEKEGEDIYSNFIKKMENKYSIKFNTDYSNVKNYIPKIQLKDVEVINNMEDNDLPEEEEILVELTKKSGESHFPENIHFVYKNNADKYFHLESLKYLIHFIVNKLYKGHGSKTVHLTQNKENVIYKIKK